MILLIQLEANIPAQISDIDDLKSIAHLKYVPKYVPQYITGAVIAGLDISILYNCLFIVSVFPNESVL
ncbi:TPA: hypothetical protein DIC40_04975 [Patescibacteria group bacterium]|nr:hypothetical protein [Candidatus Gracilibacteria bacterium]